jgi:16S rRNA (cytidine1402-2'-O)-methyltransferase
MPGTLFVVSTPIGNLEDITLRALRVLREVAVIAAEDTRHTRGLLTHFDIRTPLLSLHEHNERARVPALLARLLGGEGVALVADAGTPLVSDPGATLVEEARAAGVRVEAVPGPSAVLAALVASGLSASSGFTFAGFPPAKAGARTAWLEAIAAEPRPVVFFEAPHRIRATLTALEAIAGNRRVAVARELTKLHEEVVSGPLREAISGLDAPRGEFTVVLAPGDSEPVPDVSDERLWDEFRALTGQDRLSRREAVAALARQYQRPARSVYAALERMRARSDNRDATSP